MNNKRHKFSLIIPAALTIFLMSFSNVLIAQGSSLFEGFTIVEMTDAAREIYTGDAVDAGDRKKIIGTMLVLISGDQGYATTSAGGLNCHSWVRAFSDSVGRTLFGRGTMRAAGELVACTEFTLRKNSADTVIFGADNREEELRIIRRFPVTPVDWSQPIFDRFTLFDQRLGPRRIEIPNLGSMRSTDLDFAGIHARIQTSSGEDVVSLMYEIEQARQGGPVDIMWARYDGYYRQEQPLVDVFRGALVKRYGQPSITKMTKQGRQVYVWAHDMAGNQLPGPEENVEQCYHGTDITVREPLGMISKRGSIGPWSCGVVLAVTTLPTRGPGNTGADVISEYKMILYHGHALALKRFARRQRQILVTRDEINAIYDAEKPVF